jgi:hypothetical protein
MNSAPTVTYDTETFFYVHPSKVALAKQLMPDATIRPWPFTSKHSWVLVKPSRSRKES